MFALLIDGVFLSFRCSGWLESDRMRFRVLTQMLSMKCSVFCIFYLTRASSGVIPIVFRILRCIYFHFVLDFGTACTKKGCAVDKFTKSDASVKL